jgi:hypothetical protein
MRTKSSDRLIRSQSMNIRSTIQRFVRVIVEAVKWDDVHGEFGLATPDRSLIWNQEHETLHDHIAHRLGFAHTDPVSKGYTKFVNGSTEISIEMEDTKIHKKAAKSVLDQIGDHHRPVHIDIRSHGGRMMRSSYVDHKSFAHSGHAKLWLSDQEVPQIHGSYYSGRYSQDDL